MKAYGSKGNWDLDDYGPPTWTKENFFIKVGGASFGFRCTSCGSNVFKKRKDNPLKYKCNGCDATYTGEV